MRNLFATSAQLQAALQVRQADLQGRLELRRCGEQVAHLANRFRQLRFGLVQRHLCILLVQPHERLPGLHELRVVGPDRDDGSVNLRRDLHHVAAHVGVIGRLHVTPLFRPPHSVGGAEDDEDGRCHTKPAQAPCLERESARLGLGRQWGLGLFHRSLAFAEANNA